MDDCSPDHTGEVAKSFSDSRIKYIRNEKNLGHLHNYNKGIALSSGDYIWLISADDRLRSRHVAAQYLEVMEENAQIGYAFCPGMALQGDCETGVLKYSFHGPANTIYNGHQFFCKLLNSNSVVAASGMVRRECYERYGAFPLDLPYAGDWYLWLLFALHYDVAYFSEAMVNYRQHGLSMTTTLNGRDPRICTRDDLAVLWRIKHKAQEFHYFQLDQPIEEAIIDRSSLFLSVPLEDQSRPCFTFEDFEELTTTYSYRARERRRVRSCVYSKVADERFWQGDCLQSSRLYRRSIAADPLKAANWTKYILLCMGETGAYARRMLRGTSKRHFKAPVRL